MISRTKTTARAIQSQTTTTTLTSSKLFAQTRPLSKEKGQRGKGKGEEGLKLDKKGREREKRRRRRRRDRPESDVMDSLYTRNDEERRALDQSAYSDRSTRTGKTEGTKSSIWRRKICVCVSSSLFLSPHSLPFSFVSPPLLETLLCSDHRPSPSSSTSPLKVTVEGESPRLFPGAAASPPPLPSTRSVCSGTLFPFFPGCEEERTKEKGRKREGESLSA